jgi:peptidoglycan/LPS O-acetylase OafA/YrhL
MGSSSRAPSALSGARIPELDGLRGLAILLVLVWHYAVTLLNPSQNPLVASVKQGLSLTWSGVDLFFVLSGFLIGGILLDNRGSPNYFRAFYVRRACRILPPYYALLALALLGIAIARAGGGGSVAWMFERPLPLWSYATFTQNFVMARANTFGPDSLGITWSLAIEEQFYLFLPLLVRRVPLRRLPYVLVLFILAAPLIRVAFYELHANGSFPGYVMMPARADSLLLGVLAAYLMRKERLRRSVAENLPGLYAIVVLLFGGAAILSRRGPGVGPGTSYEMSYVGHSWLALLYLALLILAVTESRGPVSALTRSGMLRRLGQISYGVYLIHQLVSGMAHGLILSQRPKLENVADAAVTAFALTATLGLAVLSWRYFESPIFLWGHGFKYDEPRHALAPPLNAAANP